MIIYSVGRRIPQMLSLSWSQEFNWITGEWDKWTDTEK